MNLVSMQTKNMVLDSDPATGFHLLKQSGFDAADFSLNQYLTNTDLYQLRKTRFFDRPLSVLKEHLSPIASAAQKEQVRIFQMHMPYPLYIHGAGELNTYLAQTVAPKSLQLCAFLNCPYIVVHGFKLASSLGSEEQEWALTEAFLKKVAPLAKELGVTLCLENLYDSIGGRLAEGPCSNAAKAVDRIDRLNELCHAEVFGFCFDTGHANLLGIRFEPFLRTLGPRLKVLHIHDNDGVSDLHQMPYTFTRTRENAPSTDWDGFLSGLKASHYAGTLNFEMSPTLSAFPETLRPQVLKWIAQIGRDFAEKLARQA